MAHESFERESTAALMNERFINIKVDREERPDIDAIYQKVVALMGQGGGWPLTVFLTPDQRPFYGGTYFPPEDRYGRPGFERLLTILSDLWTDKRADALRQADAFMEGLDELAGILDEQSGAPLVELDDPRSKPRRAAARSRVTIRSGAGSASRRSSRTCRSSSSCSRAPATVTRMPRAPWP